MSRLLGLIFTSFTIQFQLIFPTSSTCLSCSNHARILCSFLIHFPSPLPLLTLISQPARSSLEFLDCWKYSLPSWLMVQAFLCSVETWEGGCHNSLVVPHIQLLFVSVCVPSPIPDFGSSTPSITLYPSAHLVNMCWIESNRRHLTSISRFNKVSYPWVS